jgi:hypothetical protein
LPSFELQARLSDLLKRINLWDPRRYRPSTVNS